MSSICDDLRAAILQAAMQGKLTNSDEESWDESEIGNVCELCTGNSISESIKKSKYMKVTEGQNYIGTKDLAFDHSFNYDNGVKIPFDEKKFRIANRDDILLCIEGGSAGRKIGILEEDVNYGNKLCRISPNDKLNNKFLYFYIQSPLFQEQFSDSMTGIIGGVSVKKIKAIIIRFPNITEQKRIVEKVDELMARVADLEKSADALASLKKSFPDDIKASLLQAAMQGKLTEQLPEDGTAEELLEQIKVEKEKLIAEGKIKKQKPLTPIIDDEIPFEIPGAWKWTRLGDLTTLISDGTHKTPKYTENGIPFLSVQNISKGYFDFSKIKYISEKEHIELTKRIKPAIDDILICRIGTLGKALKNTLNYEFSIFVSLGIVRLIDARLVNYIVLVINSPVGFKWIQENKVGGGTHTYKINLSDFPNMLIPLPPLAEQKRIVERLEKLMQNINAVGELIANE